jgi:hypothetical protein
MRTKHLICVYISSRNLRQMLIALQNSHELRHRDIDWSTLPDDRESRRRFRLHHPRALGEGYSTNIQQCEETGRYFINVMMTVRQIRSLKDNPITGVRVQRSDARVDRNDPESPLRPLPVLMRKIYDLENVWTGEYSEETICIQR